jgi:hypothetical protein
MTALTADDAMVTLLRQANGVTEIRDASGTVIGFFAPVSLERASLYVQAVAQTDPQETRQRKEAGGGTHPTEEVLDRLNVMKA